MRKVQNLTEWQKYRLGRIKQYREKGYSFSRIGKIMKLSKARIREIYICYQ